jgi:hypothetical protein
MADLLDRCSSPSFDNDIRLCLNDLCQRVVFIVDQSLTDIYNQIPSPVFTRKMESQTTKEVNHVDEQSQKKKRNRLTTKKPVSDNTSSITLVNEKKDEPLEQESSDVKPMILTSNVFTAPLSTTIYDYICEWDDCRA